MPFHPPRGGKALRSCGSGATPLRHRLHPRDFVLSVWFINPNPPQKPHPEGPWTVQGVSKDAPGNAGTARHPASREGVSEPPGASFETGRTLRSGLPQDEVVWGGRSCPFCIGRAIAPTGRKCCQVALAESALATASSRINRRSSASISFRGTMFGPSEGAGRDPGASR